VTPRLNLALRSVERQDEAPGQQRLRLLTEAGAIDCRLQAAETGDAAVLWVFGAGGGLGGPAGGLYTRLGQRLRPRGITSLELAYRHPGRLQDCVQDVLLGLDWLGSEGRRRVVLVGHSFGGAVVITAGAASEAVIAVAALSSQTGGTEAVADLAPRPLLVAHGTADEVLPEGHSPARARAQGSDPLSRLPAWPRPVPRGAGPRHPRLARARPRSRPGARLLNTADGGREACRIHGEPYCRAA
jgi:hypothetical protein